MKTMPRAIALAAATVLALTGCIRIEMNVDLQEDDTANGEIIMAFSQEMLALAGEDGIDEMLAQENDIEGAVVERYESEDTNAAGEPAFVGARTSFTDMPLAEFDAAGDDLKIVRDGDDYVVSGVVEDLADQTGGEELPMDASFTLSVTFPGEVSSHNGQLDGNTVTWDLMTHTDDIEARGSATAGGGDGFPVWLLIVIIALVGVGIGIAVVLVVATKRKPTDESQAGNFGVAGAGAASPLVGADPGYGATAAPIEPVVESDPVIDNGSVISPEPVVDEGPATDGGIDNGDETPRA